MKKNIYHNDHENNAKEERKRRKHEYEMKLRNDLELQFGDISCFSLESIEEKGSEPKFNPREASVKTSDFKGKGKVNEEIRFERMYLNSTEEGDSSKEDKNEDTSSNIETIPTSLSPNKLKFIHYLFNSSS